MTAFPDYKGYSIQVEPDGTFKAKTPFSQEEGVMDAAEAKTLTELKEKLDKITKAKISGKFSVWIQNRHSWRHDDNQFILGKITSVTNKHGDSSDRNNFRVTWKNKNGNTEWEDCSASELVKDIEENKVLMKQYSELAKSIKKAESEKEQTLKKMTYYKETELMDPEVSNRKPEEKE
jgi:hypothetical protein